MAWVLSGENALGQEAGWALRLVQADLILNLIR